MEIESLKNHPHFNALVDDEFMQYEIRAIMYRAHDFEICVHLWQIDKDNPSNSLLLNNVSHYFILELLGYKSEPLYRFDLCDWQKTVDFHYELMDHYDFDYSFETDDPSCMFTLRFLYKKQAIDYFFKYVTHVINYFKDLYEAQRMAGLLKPVRY